MFRIPKVGEDYWMTTYDGEQCWGRSNDRMQPTHWMPMPEPPEDGNKQKG